MIHFQLHQHFLLLMSLFSLGHADILNDGIIGGHEAKPHSKPYMAYLTMKHNGKTYICSGFLVSAQFVMTAAHCDGTDINVLLGSHNVHTHEKSQQKFEVKQKFLHPNYTEALKGFDIMLLKLNRIVNLNSRVHIILLPKENSDVPVGTVCNVAGWGLVNSSSVSNVLMEVNVPVISNDECRKEIHVLTDNMMCAGEPGTNKDSAQGDSGGPLVCNGEAQGIVSFGEEKPPGVYTRISKFIPWIKKTLQSFE
ncbi:mast cell protease 1A-like [Protopterus annectens]|uniref:mast cell protease 1A-like n=1 Tax=Protopterus annectens TaxID=7888 RepID=UPI001CF991B7|nr:mast cell protease 1A-like [Protopterus annectens]